MNELLVQQARRSRSFFMDCFNRPLATEHTWPTMSHLLTHNVNVTQQYAANTMSV